MIEDAGLIAKTLEHSCNALCSFASAAFLERYGHPESPAELPKFSAAASSDGYIPEGGARWTLAGYEQVLYDTSS